MLLSRKGILAIAAVIDVALHSSQRPVSAKALAHRHGLPPRHLEPVLQALVHDGILKGVRGPRGGYELGRDQNQITAVEILRAAGNVDEDSDAKKTVSTLIDKVVLPAISQAQNVFATALAEITIASLAEHATTEVGALANI